MAITMKVGEMKIAEEALAAMLDAEGVPGKIGMKLARIARKVGEETKTLEERRNKLITELGVPNDTGATEVPEAKRPEFFQRFNDMLTTESTLDVEPLTDEELEQIAVKPKFYLMLGALKA